MAQRACMTCGRSFTPRSSRQRRCPAHQGTGTGYSHNRDSAAQARFRKAVLARDGHRCTYIEAGHRCTATTDLRACHLQPLAEGGSYDPANGTTRCGRHDRATDPRAR